MTRHVTFHEDCRYTLPGYNSLDVNKLFGLSFGLFAVHENSARFGWAWNEADQCVDLLAYCYINGERNWNEQKRFPVVAQVKLGQRVKCTIMEHGSSGYYGFTVRDPETESVLGVAIVTCPRSLPFFGLTHSLYFGGALPAPHDMHVTMTKE